MIDASRPLLLGSASPRRREIVATLGIPCVVAAVDVDETPAAGEAPGAYLARIVRAKLTAALGLELAAAAGACLVADTSVILDAEILGKPTTPADAARMIRALSGRAHEVHTRFAIGQASSPGAPLHEETVVSRVVFRALTDGEIEGYVATGEGADKAGAYAVQGIGAFAVQRIEGSYGAVVGLPACEVVLALRDLGLLGAFPR